MHEQTLQPGLSQVQNSNPYSYALVLRWLCERQGHGSLLMGLQDHCIVKQLYTLYDCKTAFQRAQKTLSYILNRNRFNYGCVTWCAKFTGKFNKQWDKISSLGTLLKRVYFFAQNINAYNFIQVGVDIILFMFLVHELFAK